MKNKIAILGNCDSGLSSVAIRALEQLYADDRVIMVPNEFRPVTVTRHPLTPKQVEVIKLMQHGEFIETTNHCSRCNGIHITPSSLKQLKAYGLIKRLDYIGNNSSRHCLTKEGLEYPYYENS